MQVKPVLVVHWRAFEVPEHDGIANAAGAEVEAVAFATTVLAAIDDSPASGTVAHPGAVDAPVETIV
jgi:hypothetical protein